VDIDRQPFGEKAVVAGRVDMHDLMQQRAVVRAHPRERHLHEAAVPEMPRHERPGNPVRGIDVHADRLLPRGTPVLLHLLALGHGIAAIRLRLARGQLPGKNPDRAALRRDFRSGHTLHRRNGEHDDRQ